MGWLSGVADGPLALEAGRVGGGPVLASGVCEPVLARRCLSTDRESCLVEMRSEQLEHGRSDRGGVCYPICRGGK